MFSGKVLIFKYCISNATARRFQKPVVTVWGLSASEVLESVSFVGIIDSLTVGFIHEILQEL